MRPIKTGGAITVGRGSLFRRDGAPDAGGGYRQRRDATGNHSSRPAVARGAEEDSGTGLPRQKHGSCRTRHLARLPIQHELGQVLSQEVGDAEPYHGPHRDPRRRRHADHRQGDSGGGSNCSGHSRDRTGGGGRAKAASTMHPHQSGCRGRGPWGGHRNAEQEALPTSKGANGKGHAQDQAHRSAAEVQPGGGEPRQRGGSPPRILPMGLCRVGAQPTTKRCRGWQGGRLATPD